MSSNIDYKPEIMQKEMIVIKGRKLKSDCE